MKDDSPFTHVLYHDDLSQLPEGCFDKYPHFKVVARGLGKYLVAEMPPLDGTPRLHTFGDETWGDYRLRAVVTPLSFEKCPPAGGYCGIVARYKNEGDYIALVLSRDGHLKLLRRTPFGFNLLATAPLVFCMGQSLSMTLTVAQGEIVGVAGPYAGATVVKATLPAGAVGACGKAGFISSAESRFGPHTAECTPEEAAHIETVRSQTLSALEKKRAAFPQMKLELTVPLNGPASMYDIRIVDINGDGKLEILAGHRSSEMAEQFSLTRLTALTAYDLSGKLLWQAGIIDPDPTHGVSPFAAQKLPFEVHDLYGDGHPVIVCVFGYDLQIRDGKTGRVMMSATTPATEPVSDEFKAVATAIFGGIWGDETLNMNVAHIGFCDTQGSGGKREIIVRDGFHNLAVLDPLSEPILQPLFTHRGNLGGKLWSGDLDGDGKDEILAGYSLLDDDGRLLDSLVLGGEPHAALVLDPLNENGAEKRIYLCAGSAGLLAVDVQSRLEGYPGFTAPESRVSSCAPSELIAAKMRADLPGIQFLAIESGWPVYRYTLIDSSLNEIWSREFDSGQGNIEPINWTGKQESLVLRPLQKRESQPSRCELLDGHGDVVVESPAFGAEMNACVLKKYCPDGRDAIAAWNNNELAIYVPVL